MKKFVRAAVLLCALFLCARVSFAAEVPSWVDADCYYQGDPNYVYVQGYHGTDIYIDVSSIVPKLYEPPEYEISAIAMIVDLQLGTQRYVAKTWHYHYDPQNEKRLMFVWTDGEEENWRYVPKFGEKGECMANTVLVRLGGEFVWWKCYQMNFYYNKR